MSTFKYKCQFINFNVCLRIQYTFRNFFFISRFSIAQYILFCQPLDNISFHSTPMRYQRPNHQYLHTFCTDGDELNSLAGNVIQSFVNVCDFVKSHLSPIWLWKCLTRYNFQEEHKFKTIAEIFIDIVYRRACFP